MQHILTYTWHIFFHKYGGCAYSLTHVQLFETPWTVAHQAPLSTGILQARILEWVAIPFSRDPPIPGIKPRSPAYQADFLPSESPWKLNMVSYCTNKIPF